MTNDFLTIKEVITAINKHGKKFTINDFVTAYRESIFEVFINFDGLIAEVHFDHKGLLAYIDGTTIKPYEGIVKPLDDKYNQNIAHVINGKGEPFSMIAHEGKTYILLDHYDQELATDSKADPIVCSMALKTMSDLIVPQQDLKNYLQQPKLKDRNDKNTENENEKLLKVIGAMLHVMKKSGRINQNFFHQEFNSLIQNEAQLKKTNVTKIFKRANDIINPYIKKDDIDQNLK